ncbi:hypothetical protein [Sphingomonas soli]|uniref:PAS domain-containing protein n=1 Tax=Sphingomonas soli TaxID=266127 RepID=UPI00082ECADA
MDMSRGINDPLGSGDPEPNEAVSDRPLDIGTDERRMHVRAYNHWVSLLRGRAYPSIEDLDPGSISDFGAHSVLLDFSQGIDDPAIRFLGKALREETGLDATITLVAQVPSRSLLSRLTDHYLQIIANRAPIGFEAEFVGTRGHNTMYRGILMPFSSNGEEIDFIYGVINWKELVDAATQARLNAEVDEARRTAPSPAIPAPVWADGPSAGFDAGDDLIAEDLAAGAAVDSTLADRLFLARESAAAARASDTRSRSALYRALARSYDFALAAESDQAAYAELLEDAGLKAQARAPMTPAVKLVFGADYDKTRLTEFAAVLSFARRTGVPSGGLDSFLDAADGGIKGVVAAERAHRRPAPRPDRFARIAEELRSRPPIAHIDLPADGEFVVLLARKGKKGMDILAQLADTPLTERTIRKAAA